MRALAIKMKFEAEAVIHGGRPILLLSESHGHAIGGPVRARKSDLRQFADQLKLVEVERKWTGSHEHDAACVIYGKDFVSVEFSGDLAPMKVAAHPSAEWLALAGVESAILVALAIPGEFAKAVPEAVFGNGRAYGAHVPLIRLRDRRSDHRYQILDADGVVTPIPGRHSVLVDSNVVIDVERAASGALHDSERIEDVQQLVLALVHADPIPGMALFELTQFGFSPTINARRHRELTAGWSAWFGGGAQRASDLAAVRAAHAEALRAPPDEPPKEMGIPFPTQVVMYACLCKFATIWARAQGGFRARQRVDLYEEFVEWMANDLGVVVAYAQQVARDRLIGPQGASVRYVDKLLKFGKNKRRKLWGASWDISHLALIDAPAFGLGDVFENDHRSLCLVTGDKALPFLRQRMRHGATTMLDGKPILVANASAGDLDRKLEDHGTRIAAIDANLGDVVHRRAITGHTPELEQLVAAARRAEAALDEPDVVQ